MESDYSMGFSYAVKCVEKKKSRAFQDWCEPIFPTGI
jgi:hypothetical protein